MATDKPRFSITLDDELLERIERFQKQHGYSTKSRAIQALVERGLKAYKVNPPAPKEPRDKQEERFMKLYGNLSTQNRRFLQSVIELLLQQSQ